MTSDHNERTGSREDDEDRAPAYGIDNCIARVECLCDTLAGDVWPAMLHHLRAAKANEAVYDAAVEWQRAHAERQPKLTETIGAYCRLEDAVAGAEKREPPDPAFSTVSRIIRTLRTWTPNARRMLAAAMGAEFPAEANRDATLRAVSERKRMAQRRELRRLNERLAVRAGEEVRKRCRTE